MSTDLRSIAWCELLARNLRGLENEENEENIVVNKCRSQMKSGPLNLASLGTLNGCREGMPAAARLLPDLILGI